MNKSSSLSSFHNHNHQYKCHDHYLNIIAGCGNFRGVRVVDSLGLAPHPHPGPPDSLLQVWVGQRKVKLVKIMGNFAGAAVSVSRKSEVSIYKFCTVYFN